MLNLRKKICKKFYSILLFLVLIYNLNSCASTSELVPLKVMHGWQGGMSINPVFMLPFDIRASSLTANVGYGFKDIDLLVSLNYRTLSRFEPRIYTSILSLKNFTFGLGSSISAGLFEPFYYDFFIITGVSFPKDITLALGAKYEQFGYMQNYSKLDENFIYVLWLQLETPISNKIGNNIAHKLIFDLAFSKANNFKTINNMDNNNSIYLPTSGPETYTDFVVSISVGIYLNITE